MLLLLLQEVYYSHQWCVPLKTQLSEEGWVMATIPPILRRYQLTKFGLLSTD